ncbi:hypothetical protein V5N11_017024 [Cardamine amara subsp. amara]|uniref:DUF4283 domain-containing protein n=1 Tax=Cardamine amara subsp. amara TaxID=228776 RepID=A0ABD1BIA1_CARAN
MDVGGSGIGFSAGVSSSGLVSAAEGSVLAATVSSVSKAAVTVSSSEDASAAEEDSSGSLALDTGSGLICVVASAAAGFGSVDSRVLVAEDGSVSDVVSKKVSGGDLVLVTSQGSVGPKALDACSGKGSAAEALGAGLVSDAAVSTIVDLVSVDLVSVSGLGGSVTEGLLSPETLGGGSVEEVSAKLTGEPSGSPVPAPIGMGHKDISFRSYSSVVQQTSSLSKHEITVSMEEGDSIIHVPEDILNDSLPLWDNLIVGRFPDASPHIAKVHVIVNKIWRYGNKDVKIDAYVVNATTIKFRIRDPVIRDKVLRRRMWNIAYKPMFLSKDGPISEETQPAIISMPMWIEIKNVPPSYFSWKGLSFLSSVVGVPKKIHPDTLLCKKYDEARIFVEVDLTNQLPQSFRFKSSQGVTSEVLYSYPWLPPKCSICEKWGHTSEECIANPNKKSEAPRILKRGEKMVPQSAQKVSTNHEFSPIISSATVPIALSKEPSHHVCEDTDGCAPPLSETLSVRNSGQEPSKLVDKGVEKLQATAQPAYKDADEGAVGVENENNSTTSEPWREVSPRKKSNHVGQLPIQQQISVSPSRFSVLENAENSESQVDSQFGKPKGKNKDEGLKS